MKLVPFLATCFALMAAAAILELIYKGFGIDGLLWAVVVLGLFAVIAMLGKTKEKQ